MKEKLPVDFEQKVKAAPPVNGRGYPYQLSASDLMRNFKFLRDLIKVIEAGGSGSEALQVAIEEQEESLSISIQSNAPSDGTYVLGSVGGVLQWIQTEEC